MSNEAGWSSGGGEKEGGTSGAGDVKRRRGRPWNTNPNHETEKEQQQHEARKEERGRSRRGRKELPYYDTYLPFGNPERSIKGGSNVQQTRQAVTSQLNSSCSCSRSRSCRRGGRTGLACLATSNQSSVPSRRLEA